MYLFYGDTTLLKSSYENIKRYVDHINDRYPTGLTSWGLGDWVPVKTTSPVEFTSSIYYFVDAHILSEAAKLLGKTDDEIYYRALSQKIKEAINAKYLNVSAGIYGKGSQTELSAPLYWNIVPENLKPKVAANLAKRVEQDKLHLDVGLLGTKTILNALSEHGYADLAYKIAAQESYPSWGWWIVNGATTLYENWNIDAANDISMNHIMFGEIGAWLYKALGGIKPDRKIPGFRHILLQPHFVADLNAFEAEYNSSQGMVRSSWKKENKQIHYQVTIPPNTTATLTIETSNKKLYENNKTVKPLPSNAKEKSDKVSSSYLLEAGSYSFVLK